MRSLVVLSSVALLVAGCSTSPAASTTAPPSTGPAPTTAPPPASQAPVPTATVWHPYAIPDKATAALLAVGSDGTVYVELHAVDANGVPTNSRVVALDPGGSPSAGWTAPTIPAGSFAIAGAAGPDGSLYLALEPSGPEGHIQVLALDRDGTVLPGWPVTVGPGFLATRGFLVDDQGTVRFGWANRGAGVAAMEARARDGTSLAGWPVKLKARAVFFEGLGSDGTAYVDLWTGDGPLPTLLATLRAIDSSGKDLAGWTPYTTKPGLHGRDVPISTGIVRVVYSAVGGPPRDAYTWLDAAGHATGVAVTGPNGMTEFDVLPWHDTIYAVDYTNGPTGLTGPGQIVAYGPEGKVPAGWPVKFEGWPEAAAVASDGTVWVVEHISASKVKIVGVHADGSPVAGTPLPADLDENVYTTAALGPDGTFYTIVQRAGTLEVIAVK